MYQAKVNKKKVGIRISVSNVTELRQNQIKRHKVAQFIKLKCTLCNENKHANDISTNLREVRRDEQQYITGKFNAPFSTKARPRSKK